MNSVKCGQSHELCPPVVIVVARQQLVAMLGQLVPEHRVRVAEVCTVLSYQRKLFGVVLQECSAQVGSPAFLARRAPYLGSSPVVLRQTVRNSNAGRAPDADHAKRLAQHFVANTAGSQFVSRPARLHPQPKRCEHVNHVHDFRAERRHQRQKRVANCTRLRRVTEGDNGLMLASDSRGEFVQGSHLRRQGIVHHHDSFPCHADDEHGHAVPGASQPSTEAGTSLFGCA
mmetsp:Transcript_8418/g.29919  ORF Transcript_8418/g.29919 Transcript_8418/m.29919 type:complete len:229 (+) Transcript_8418:1445-2131(+)